ncbi:MAG: LysR family transcriptional regulator [Vannielia sp.]|uniref:hydrogen peroxide-inducible genes activator n=1 Tax=Rhodobacterales TaxID=204455 RepID=UPI002094B2D5|nr:hydrogen peroxide-inducible genes activator [Oceanicola sp. 502str15]MCO6382174.1 LysR family transcriptional regulator [Oceanicola sp. 502str15]
MNLTLRQLRSFAALADTGSFVGAAEVVHVSQPALSQQIKEMEAQTGFRLVERQPRRAVLTPAGHELLGHARTVLAAMDTLEQAARWRDGLGGRLSLGVIPTVAPYLLPVALPLIRSRNLGLELQVRESQTDPVLDALESGRLDAAVVALPSGRPGLIEEPLFEDRFLLAGNAATLAGQGAGIRPDALDPDRLLLLEEGHCLADQALEVCALRRADTRVDLGASSLATLAGLVAEGFGFTFLPELAAASELAASPKLALRRFSAPEPSRRLGLLRRRTATDDGWFTALADLLRDAGRSRLAEVPI